MSVTTRRTILLILSLIITFAVLRISLYISPNSNFNVGQYNVHHLFTGIAVLVFAVIPLILKPNYGRLHDLLIIIFGVGLSMVLDEWVYLIATDGSDVSYWLPVSFWGGVIVIGIACLYTFAVWLYSTKCCTADPES